MTKSDDLGAAVASHTHLFPGAVLRIESGETEGKSAFKPRALRVSFSDGSQSRAELVSVVGPDGEIALIVEGYTTAAGTTVPQKMWHIASKGTEGGALNLRIGPSLPFE